MIFLTVGTQLPFDRLIQLVDEYPEISSQKVICQNGSGTYVPKNFQAVTDLTLNEYNKVIIDCSVIISHAGMGSILTAMKYKKPIIILPRLLSLKEIRSEHQVPTANAFSNIEGVYSVFHAQGLYKVLDDINELSSFSGIKESQRYQDLQRFFQGIIK